jgi:type IV secretion system protein VirB3
MDRNGGVIADTLFVGVTRPALALGVPYAALLVNGLVALELFLVTQNLLWILVCVPLHGLAWLVCLAEPRFFELLAVWAQVRSRGGLGGHRRWRAVSYGAFKVSRTLRRAEIGLVVVESGGGPSCLPR